jgi:F-type H+-transporting ATPase subunit gamma
MPSLRDLKRRIKSVAGIRQITRAMEMVSATKLRRAQLRIESARPYTDKMDEMVAHLAKTVDPEMEPHPLMVARDEVKRLMIVAIASDKGLCGSFNANVMRATGARARKAEEEGIGVSLFLIGRKLHDFFRRRNWPIESESERYRGIDQTLPIELLVKLTDHLVRAFQEGATDQVDVVYTEFRSAISHKIVLRQFIPITGLEPQPVKEEEREEHEPAREYIFEPVPEELFSLLIPKYATALVFRMLAESLASEHGGRMTAMRNATDNAADMIKALTLQRNKARQAAITKELSEIVAGAEALRG